MPLQQSLQLLTKRTPDTFQKVDLLKVCRERLFVMVRAVDCLLWLMDELKKAHAVFLARDKGNQEGVDHLAKVLSWWDKTD